MNTKGLGESHHKSKDVYGHHVFVPKRRHSYETVRVCILAWWSQMSVLQRRQYLHLFGQHDALPLPSMQEAVQRAYRSAPAIVKITPLLKWVWALYLEITALKGVSSMKLHCGLDVTQRTAWFMLQRIRKAFEPLLAVAFEGSVEVDETYVGEKESSEHEDKKSNPGRSTVGEAAVAGVKNCKTGAIRAQVVPSTDGLTLKQFVYDHTKTGSTGYTDESRSYSGLVDLHHETVTHSVGEWISGMAHTNGLRGFWSRFKHAYHGTYYQLSRKHLNRYIQEFAGKYNIRKLNTMAQMPYVVACMVGIWLRSKDLIA